MGAVYRARHVYLEEERAIKVIRAGLAEDVTPIERFIREAKILVRLRHPNLVQLHEFGTLEDGSFFMVMEFCSGESVAQRLQRVQRLPIEPTIAIVRETALGLQAAHAQGVVHRDIAPDNLILVKAEGDREITKIIDFGIAKPVAEDLQQQQTLATGFFIGKPQYCSPEQCGMLERGEHIDHRSDIYSLGVTFYQMLTGKLPFIADSPYALLLKHVNEAPPAPSSHFPEGQFPAELDRIILRTLAKKRIDRYSSMEDLLADLDEYSPPAEAKPKPKAILTGLRPGTLFAERYRIERQLGKGTLGANFLAMDTLVGIPVVLTVLDPKIAGHQQVMEQLTKDVNLTRTVTHPNICRVYDLYRHENLAYLTMDFIDGRTLNAVLRSEGALPLPVALPIIRQITEALHALHQAGLTHSALSPQNIVIDDHRRVFLMDVALTHAIAECRTTKDGAAAGDANYKAPELHEGKDPDPRSDLYSLGVIMFHMLTGQPPFVAADPIKTAVMHLQSVPPKPSSIKPDVPLELDRIILQLLSKDTAGRPGSAEEVLRELDALAVPAEVGDASREVLVHRMMMEGRYSHAAKILSSLIETDPGNAQWKKLLDTALTEKASKDVRRAKRLIREKQFKQADIFLARIGAARIPGARVSAQVKKLREQLDQEINAAVDLYCNEAEQGLKSGNKTEALCSLEAALEIKAVDPRLEKLKSRINQLKQAPSSADADLKLTLHDALTHDLEEAARLQRDERLQTALEKIISILERDPENERAHELEISIRVSIEEKELSRILAELVGAAIGLLTSERGNELPEALKALHSSAADTSYERDVEVLHADLQAFSEMISTSRYQEALTFVREMSMRHRLIRPHERVLCDYATKLLEGHQTLVFSASLSEGIQAFQQKRWEAARTFFGEALQVRPDDQSAQQYLTEAEGKLDNATRIQKRLRSTLYQLELAANMQSWDEVLRLCAKALEPEFAECMAAKEVQQIRQSEDRARTGRIQTASMRAAQLTAEGNLLGAREFYRKILEWVPQSPLALAGIHDVETMLQSAFRSSLETGERFAQEEQWEEALTSIKEALAIEPHDKSVQKKIAEIHGRLDAERKARDLFRKNAIAGRKLFAGGNVDAIQKALFECERCISDHAHLDDLRIELGALREDAQKNIEREKTKLKLIEGVIASARNLRATGELEIALEKLLDLLKAIPNHPDALALKTEIQNQINQERKCRQQFVDDSQRCSRLILTGDLDGAQKAFLSCQESLPLGMGRLNDLSIELAALEGDLHEATGKKKKQRQPDL